MHSYQFDDVYLISDQGSADEGTSCPPISSNLQESWSKVSHAARELATVFSVTFFLSNNSWSIGQNANSRCLDTSLLRVLQNSAVFA